MSSNETHRAITPALAYVLVTPARNEAEFIELTLKSVVSQSVRPLRWVIVSDGSTDGTDEIVSKYAKHHDWIELVRAPERTERHFAGKVHAFNAGYARLQGLPYDIIGNLDADISFEPDYFSFLLSKFQIFPGLGVAGTPFKEGNSTYDFRFSSIEHVSGGCQLFRRECFEAIGGYKPVKGGGIDLIAVVSARMKGWQTRTFTEKIFDHHRAMGSAGHSLIRAKFNLGKKDYALGGHPLWELVRATYQLVKPPFILGGCSILAGYLSAALRHAEKPVPAEFVAFRRREQMLRLRARLLGRSQPANVLANVPAALKPACGDQAAPGGTFRRREHKYVLITAARNEAAFIERVLLSMVTQTVRPMKWVIVSDGSWDGTDEIVNKYAAAHDWIELLRMPDRSGPSASDRNFAGKADAFNAGWARVKDLHYDYVGNLDADISFGVDHFEFLSDRLAENSKLGMVGTAFQECNASYNYRIVGLEHVSGQCQFFRRECLEELGGYQPVKGGGIDLIAVTTAQMLGWQTRTFTERQFEHYRPMGSARISIPKAKFRDGKKDYATGGHPLWQAGRAIYQMGNKPYLIGGCMLLAGYAWSALRREPRPVSREFVKFRRRGQMRRLKQFIYRRKTPSRPVESMA